MEVAEDRDCLATGTVYREHLECWTEVTEFVLSQLNMQRRGEGLREKGTWMSKGQKGNKKPVTVRVG